MQIIKTYSHINAVEYMKVHNNVEYEEILSIIKDIDSNKCSGAGDNAENNWDIDSLKNEFKTRLKELGWKSRLLKNIDPKENSITYERFEIYLAHRKKQVAVEIEFTDYKKVMEDFFVKYPASYKYFDIQVGVEILPMRSFHEELTRETPWFEKEVHNILGHGRTNPPVPLWIIGIEP
ncbi:MAG: hypothetical protein K9I94_06145 [Bacteroidales bacterium]|nr:hypothetical protein [Bacteroidales bacterium]